MIVIILLNVFIFVYINQLINKEKRFQETNIVDRIWRYRFYVAIPFMWMYYMIKGFRVYIDEWEGDELIHTSKYKVYRWGILWKLLIGIQQGPMKWYYTSEEVFDKIKNKYK